MTGEDRGGRETGAARGGPAPRVRIGRIVAPQGVRGAVRVQSLSDFPERWARLTQAYIGDEPTPRAVKCLGFTRGGTMPVLKISGVETRDEAEKLRGRYLEVPREQAHPLPEDTFYTFELIGLRAEDPGGVLLGRVVDVEPAPASDLLVLELADGRTARVPMVRAFVQAVDLEGQRGVIQPIPGLLDP